MLGDKRTTAEFRRVVARDTTRADVIALLRDDRSERVRKSALGNAHTSAGCRFATLDEDTGIGQDERIDAIALPAVRSTLLSSYEPVGVNSVRPYLIVGDAASDRVL